MHPAQSVVILPGNIQNTSNSYVVNNQTEIYQHHKNQYQQQFHNNLQPLIILSTPSSTSFQSISISSLNPSTGSIQTQPNKPANKSLTCTVKRQQPIKPKLKPAQTAGEDVQRNPFNSLSMIVDNKQEFKINTKFDEAATGREKTDAVPVLTSGNKKKRAAPKKAATATKSKIFKTENSTTTVNNLLNKPVKRPTKKSKYSQDKPEKEANKLTSNDTNNNKLVPPITQYSQMLFDSIEYLSSSWINIFKTGNDTDQDSLNIFRQFHCAECLKSFQDNQQLVNNNCNKNPSKKSSKSSLSSCSIRNQNFRKNLERSQMNTPPPPLQPIIDEARNGLFHYFGQLNQQQQQQSLVGKSAINPIQTTMHKYQQMSSQFVNMDLMSGQQLANNDSELKLMPNLTQIGSNLQNTMSQQLIKPIQVPNNSLANPSSETSGSFSLQFMHQLNCNVTQETNFNFNDSRSSLDGSEQMNIDDDRVNQVSIQEKGQSLSRKLAQRRSKHELIECGILPRSRVSMQHHNRMIDLKKAQLQDILKTKIEKRPNRDILIQKNILPDSAPHAAPSLIRKCTELKRARLADDLNDKLAKRPGPLELVESGILVSSDSALTDAIKGGKIQYPRTSTYIQQLEQQVNYDQSFFGTLDDPSLNYLNFNFNNLTDNDDSNSSTSTTKTTTSSTANNIKNNNSSAAILQNQTPSQPSSILSQNEIINFNELFQSTVQSPAPSPPTRPSSSPYQAVQNFDFIPTAQDKPAMKSQSSKAKAKSFSSNSSVTSTGSSFSSKTNRSSRNNSQSSNPGSNGPGSNGSNYNRKLSQLIFHEYRGPNQKSSKSSISLKTNISLKKNTNNIINAFNFKSNLVVGNNNSGSNKNSTSNGITSNNTGSTNTNEIFFDDSNDSTNNLNSAIMNIGSVSEALNPHKIRIKQQKIFLKYNTSQDASDGLCNELEQHNKDKLLNQNTNDNVLRIESSANTCNDENKMETITSNQNLSQLQQQNQILVASLANNNQTSIQLMPIQDLDMLGNLQDIFQPSAYVTNNNDSVQVQQQSIPTVSSNVLLQPPVSEPEPSVVSKPQETILGAQQQQIPSTVAKSISLSSPNIEEMSLNELKEECRRRKLLVTGNKQKLIDRIRTSRNSYHINGVKSPDSGVYMDSSPSLISNDQSPCNNLNLNNNSNSMQQINKNKTNGIGLKLPVVGMTDLAVKQAKPAGKTSSSLDDFFTFLDIENLGNSTSSIASTVTTSNLKAEPLVNGHQTIKVDVKNNGEIAGKGDNLSETKATLEMSLKNSAELLKQLSSIGQIEQMHQLENQMKESMQLIEKLKSASSSNSLQQSSVKDEAKESKNSSFFDTINSYPNKLKTVTSIPSNLKSIAYFNNNVQHQHQPVTNSYLYQHGTHYSHNQLASNNLEIPFDKNAQFVHHPISLNSNKAETVYQFDTLMKCLDGSQQPIQSVIFSCNSPQDDENSNDTRTDKTIAHKNKPSQLPSIDSLITQNMSNKSDEISRIVNHQNSTANNQCHFTAHADMDWNDTEFLKLCEELDNANNLFGKIDQKTSLQKMHHTTNDSLINGQANGYHMFENHNIINSSNNHSLTSLSSHTHVNYLPHNQPDSNHLMFSSNINGLNYNTTTNNHPQMHQQQQQISNNVSSNDFLNNQNQGNMINGIQINGNMSQTNLNSNNNPNCNMIIPWELENDLNQIATYLQSPSV